MTNCFLEENECLPTFQRHFLQLINGVFKTDSPLRYLLFLKLAFIFSNTTSKENMPSLYQSNKELDLRETRGLRGWELQS